MPTCTTCDTCGAGLLNLCDRSECYSCTSNSCYFTDNLLIDTCNSCSEATCSTYGTDQVSCYDDPCGLGNCAWINNSCNTIQLPSTYVEREIPTTVTHGQQITVYLNAHAENEYIFAIEEDVPSGWIVTSAIPSALMGTNNPQILRTYQAGEIQTLPTDFTLQYTVTAPSAGRYTFDGFYVFESQIHTVTAVTNGNNECERTANGIQNEADYNNVYYYPEDCDGYTTLGPTTITVV